MRREEPPVPNGPHSEWHLTVEVYRHEGRLFVHEPGVVGRVPIDAFRCDGWYSERL